MSQYSRRFVERRAITNVRSVLSPVSISRSILVSATGRSLVASSVSHRLAPRPEPTEYLLSLRAPHDDLAVKTRRRQKVRGTVRRSENVVFVHISSSPLRLGPQIVRLEDRVKVLS